MDVSRLHFFLVLANTVLKPATQKGMFGFSMYWNHLSRKARLVSVSSFEYFPASSHSPFASFQVDWREIQGEVAGGARHMPLLHRAGDGMRAVRDAHGHSLPGLPRVQAHRRAQLAPHFQLVQVREDVGVKEYSRLCQCSCALMKTKQNKTHLLWVQ